jgi:PAS domain S-box-containing protein
VAPAGPDGPVVLVVANRAVAVVALLACGWLAARMQTNRLRAAADARDLQEARDRLDEQHELLASAGRVGGFGGFTLDVTTGEGRVSREVDLITGMTPDASVEDRIARYLPEHRERLRAALVACRDHGEPFDEELALVRGDDGREVWVDVVGRAERGADGEVLRVHGSLHDVTARKQAEMLARQSQRRLRAMADAMPLLVWAASSDGNVDFTSRGLLEYGGEAGDGAAVLELHPDYRARSDELKRRSLTSGASYLLEAPIRRQDGVYRWHVIRVTPELEVDGEALRWWGSAIDVDDLRALEAESRVLTERLNETLESVGDAVLAVDGEWIVTLVNHNAEKLLRRSRETLVGRLLWEEFPEALGSVFEERFQAVISTRDPDRFEAEYPPLDVWLEVSAYPSPNGLTIYFRDITEARLIGERLSHVQRLESLGQLTGGVAHDFNNLLTVILGSSEVLARRLPADSPSRNLTDRISSAATRGADLTHSLLAFARRQPLHPSVVDIDALVVDTERLLGRTLGSEITVTTSLGGRGARCLVDRVQLDNALLNLCINARDAMLPAGGTLRLETSEVVLDERYAHHNEDVVPGSYVTVAVSDDGAGIAETDLDRVFEPFFTTKTDNRGSGLGLAMVYGFAKQSHGHLTIDSQLGVGTTVRLYLPMAAAGVPVLQDGRG